MHVLLIFLFFIISQATADGQLNNTNSCSLRHCTSCTKALVKCSNFTSFAEINLSNLAEIQVLDLQPFTPLFVNRSLLLHPNITITKQLILRNIRGFIFDQDPFESNINRPIELRLYSSTFQFYKRNTANLNCSSISQSFSNASILQHFSRVWLNGDMRFDGDLCPSVFKNTRIKFFLCQNMTLQNRLRFNNQDQGSDLNCSVSYLALVNSKLDQLDHKTMPVSVFKHMKTLQILGSLEGIETNLFSNFTQLKTLILELNNFNSLVRPGNMEWLGQLKSPSHSNDSGNNNRDLVVHLFDKSNVYQFTDTDFCTFQHFNPMLPIYPVIRTQPKLDCSSCTLNWLLKNWRLHKPRGSYNLLFTDSVQECLEAIDETSAQCNFAQLLENCQVGSAKNGTVISTSMSIVASSNTVDRDLVAVLEVSLANKTRENSTEQTVEATEETYKIASVGTRAPDIIAIVGTTTTTTKESVPAAVEARSLSDMMSHLINALGFFSMSAIMGFVMYLL